MGWTGQSDADMNDSLKAASEGRLRVLLDRVMPLAQAVEAHHIVTDRRASVKSSSSRSMNVIAWRAVRDNAAIRFNPQALGALCELHASFTPRPPALAHQKPLAATRDSPHQDGAEHGDTGHEVPTSKLPK